MRAGTVNNRKVKQRAGTYVRHLGRVDQLRALITTRKRRAYMNVFLSKLLVQALRKRAEGKLGRRERRGGRVAAQGSRGAGEEERAALPAAAAARSLLVDDGLATERGDCLARERKGRLDVRVRHAVDLVLGYLEERLPDGEARVEERDADVGVGPVRACGAEGGLDFCVVVVGYWERRCLRNERTNGIGGDTVDSLRGRKGG